MNNQPNLQFLLESGGEENLNQVYIYLVNSLYFVIHKYITSKKGTEEDVEEIFNDSFLVLEDYGRKKMFAPKSNIPGFFIQVCKNIWRSKISAQKFNFDEVIKAFDITVTKFNSADINKDALYKILEMLDEKCRNLLIWQYFKNIHDTEIQTRLKLGGNRSLITTRSRCMKKLRGIIKENGGKHLFYS